VISCPGTGQDGDIQAGVPWPSPRFIDHGNDTVTDNLTGLMWTKDANLPGTSKTWQEALDYVKGINTGTYSNFGYTDWRLPNRKELQSLIDRNRYNPTLPSGHPFTNVQGVYYWSSTSYAISSYNAWIVSMGYGYVDDVSKSYDDFYYVWPVRSGQVGPVHSIIGQVTGNSIGLGGVTMTLSGGASATTITAPDGTYSFADMADGSYTVTPSKRNYNFGPPGIDVTIAGANVRGVDFQVYTGTDTTPPTGSIIINNNAVWTKTTAVALKLNCTDSESGCADMRFSNDNINFTDWEPFSTNKPWVLSSVDGDEWVYVQYRDWAGNSSESFFDSINLDTTKPVVKGVSDSPDPFRHHLGEVSKIRFTLSDNLSGTCKVQGKIYNSVSTLVRTIKKNGVSCPPEGAAVLLKWDGKDKNGVFVPAGTYTYKIQATDNATNKSAIKQGAVGVE